MNITKFTQRERLNNRIGVNEKWRESISKRLGYVKRKANTVKPITAPGLVFETGLTSCNEINETFQTNEIRAEMIINIDQTPLPTVTVTQQLHNGRKGYILSFCIGYILLPSNHWYFWCNYSRWFFCQCVQLISERKTKRCQSKFNLPKEFNITQTPKE